MAEQGHEIVCHDDEVSTCFCRPEVVRYEVVYREVVLQFLNFFFRVSPAAIRVIYNLGRQSEVCDKAAVSVFPEVLLILKQFQLPDLPAAFGRFSTSCLTMTMRLGFSQPSA